MSVLHVFDFDDTLIRSDTNIIVNKKDGTKLELSSTEYKHYKPEEGDEFDYSEFDKYPFEAQIIENVFAELRAAVALGGSVVILTARQNPEPVRSFLKDNDLQGVSVVATGSDSPYAKAHYILTRLKTEDFDEAVVFEDNVKNIRTIRKVVTDAGFKLQTNRVTKTMV